MSPQGFEFSQEKQGISKGTEGTCRGTPGQIPTSGELILTYRQQVPESLHHHVLVQGPLGRVQAFPLLGSEIYEQILEGQLCLK